jgi:hypothetical protein
VETYEPRHQSRGSINSGSACASTEPYFASTAHFTFAAHLAARAAHLAALAAHLAAAAAHFAALADAHFAAMAAHLAAPTPEPRFTDSRFTSPLRTPMEMPPPSVEVHR